MKIAALLLQLGVLSFGFFQDGDVGISIFPEGEEIFVGSKRPDPGGIGIRDLRGSRLQSVGASHSQMRQRSRPAVPDDAAVVDDLLKLGGRRRALSSRQIPLAANVGGIQAGEIGGEQNLPELDRGSRLQRIQS